MTEIDSSYVIHYLKADKSETKITKCPNCNVDTTYQTRITGNFGKEKHFMKCLKCDTEFEWKKSSEAYEIV